MQPSRVLIPLNCSFQRKNVTVIRKKDSFSKSVHFLNACVYMHGFVLARDLATLTLGRSSEIIVGRTAKEDC